MSKDWDQRVKNKFNHNYPLLKILTKGINSINYTFLEEFLESMKTYLFNVIVVYKREFKYIYIYIYNCRKKCINYVYR